MSNPEHIHKAGDGRGRREVLVNGKRVDMVFYADTRRGVVRAYRAPLKLDKWRKRVLTRTLHGAVQVRMADTMLGAREQRG